MGATVVMMMMTLMIMEVWLRSGYDMIGLGYKELDYGSTLHTAGYFSRTKSGVDWRGYHVDEK